MRTIQEKQSSISATMKRRSLLTTTIEAIEEWKHQTAYKDCPVTLEKAIEGVNDDAWIDKKLFTEVIAFLLEFARRSSGNDNYLKLTVIAGGMKSSRIIIDYKLSPDRATETRSPFMMSHFNNAILQIVSQHGGTVEFNEERYGCRIVLCLPPALLNFRKVLVDNRPCICGVQRE